MLPDNDHLRRYAETRDEAAFTAPPHRRKVFQYFA
jgi:hypothetical protein